MGTKVKCEIKQGPEAGIVLLPCNGLFSLLNHQDSKSGIKRVQFMDPTSGEYTYSAIVAYSGNHKGNGLLLNCCPICGANIETWRRVKNETEVKG